jgi:Tol biopolymer transport system component
VDAVHLQARRLVRFTLIVAMVGASLAALPPLSYAAVCNVGCGSLYVMGITQLYRVDPLPESSATTTPRALTSLTSLVAPLAPSVSPDGAQIIFTHSDALQIVSAAGGALRTFAPRLAGRLMGSAAWSFDGKEVAYDVDDLRTDLSTPYGVVIADAATGSVRATWALAGHDRLDPAWTPDGRHVVVSERETDVRGSYRALVAIDVTTGAATPLTHDPAHDYTKPIVSPDGRQIAAVRSDRGPDLTGALVVMASDGSAMQVVHTANNARPAWSPDGRYLSYALGGSTYLIPATGGSPLFVTARAGGDLAWSNAGASAARAATRAFGPGPGVTSGCGVHCGTLIVTGGAVLYRIPAAGGTGQPLTTEGSTNARVGAPAVSPDGRSVAYIAGSLLTVVPIGGGSARRLGPYPFNAAPAWSPNGTAVAVGYTGFSPIAGSYAKGASYTGLAVLDASSGAALFSYALLDKATIQPAWTPDVAALIASQSQRGLPFGLVRIDLATKQALSLTTDPAHGYFHPAVSPNGRLVAAVRTASATATSGQLWVATIDGSNGHVLASQIAVDQLAWSPDGRYVAAGRAGSIVAFARDGAATTLVTHAAQVAWARPPTSSTAGTATADATATTRAPTTAQARVTINSLYLYRTVNSAYQATTTVHTGESILYAVYYTTTGVPASEATGRLSFLLPGQPANAFPLTRGTSTSGQPVLTTRLSFPPKAGMKTTVITVRITVLAGATTAIKEFHFTLTP